MGRKDKLLKEAFSVYQSVNTGQYSEKVSDGDVLPEYTEGVEDKIYHCIDRMHITNPRVKARKIKLAVLGVLILCCLSIFFVYRYKHKPVEVTKQLEDLFEEAYAWHCSYNSNYVPERVYEAGGALQYEVLPLNTELTIALEEMKLPCRKTEMTMSARYSDFCGTGAGGMSSTVWDVYELTDRKSCYYYILKNSVGQAAIARYASVRLVYNGTEERMRMGELLEDVFGVKSVKDIRSVALECYQAKNEENPETFMALYTSDAEKENILSVLGGDCMIYDASEGIDEEGEAKEEWCSIERLKGGSWYDAFSCMPENCYFMTVENRYREKQRMCVIVDGEAAQVFIDTNVKGIIRREILSDDLVIHYEEKRCIGLSAEQQKRISEWIRKAE